jgi:hypothetical protein
MKKIWIIASALLIISVFTSVSYAQFNVGAKIGPGMPVGSFGQKYNMGFGGIVNASYSINDKMQIGFNAGFYYFKGSEFDKLTDPSANIMPIFLDYKYFFNTEGFLPYAGLGIGMFLLKETVTSPAADAVYVGGALKTPAKMKEIITTSSAKFGLAPSLGFWVGNDFKWGASVSYNITFSDANFVSINAGVSLPIGN